MKIVFISFIFLFLFCITGNAQSADNYSYKDLLAQQKIERQELKETHKEILDKIIIRQKEELETARGNSGPEERIIRESRDERKEIIERFTQEREKQTQIQADERKNFLAYQKPKL